jgi:hypothetical protein
VAGRYLEQATSQGLGTNVNSPSTGLAVSLWRASRAQDRYAVHARRENTTTGGGGARIDGFTDLRIYGFIDPNASRKFVNS